MKILMVCLGNICRSPMAEGIMKHKIEKRELNWEVDSAGTSGWHVGESPDHRSVAVAKKNNIDITYQRSRQVIPKDLIEFDLLLAMDASNYRDIQSLAQNTQQLEKVKMIMNFVNPGFNQGVPDPYYHDGFDKVFEMLEEACEKIIEVHSNNEH